MKTPITELEVSVRVANCLKNIGVQYIEDIADIKESDLLRTPNFGKQSFEELKLALINRDAALPIPRGEKLNITLSGVYRLNRLLAVLIDPRAKIKTTKKAVKALDDEFGIKAIMPLGRVKGID